MQGCDKNWTSSGGIAGAVFLGIPGLFDQAGIKLIRLRGTSTSVNCTLIGLPI